MVPHLQHLDVEDERLGVLLQGPGRRAPGRKCRASGRCHSSAAGPPGGPCRLRCCETLATQWVQHHGWLQRVSGQGGSVSTCWLVIGSRGPAPCPITIWRKGTKAQEWTFLPDSSGLPAFHHFQAKRPRFSPHNTQTHTPTASLSPKT